MSTAHHEHARTTAANHEVRLPDLGEGLTEAIVARWLVAPGDEVEQDQVVAEVETAKATVELPSPFPGTVVRCHAGEGDEVAVGAVLLSLAPAGAAAPAPAAESEPAGDADVMAAGTPGDAAGAPDGAAAPGVAPTAGAPEGAIAAAPGDASTAGAPDGAVAPDAAPTAGAAGSDDGSDEGRLLVGYGTAGGRARRRRTLGAHRSPPMRTGRPRAKPPVRKLAKDLGVDLDALTGSGPDGRITRDDVRAAAAAAGSAPAQAPAVEAAPPGPVGAARSDGGGAAGQRRTPVSGVRARIADHLTVAWREIPAAACWLECDATALLAARETLAAAHPEVKVTPLALVLRCCVVALRDFPQLNASFDADARELVQHDAVHLGVATQTDRGLVVPVIRDAGTRSVLDLATQVHDLATAARANRLAPAQMVGGTFTVSNFGAFGVDGGTPIINHPEAAIVGVGRIAPRPWVVDRQLEVRDAVTVSLAFDHRVCDGGEAAGFLRRLADLIERPALLLAH